MKRFLKVTAVWILLNSFYLSAQVFADGTASYDQRFAEMEQQIQALKQQVQDLTQQLKEQQGKNFQDAQQVQGAATTVPGNSQARSTAIVTAQPHIQQSPTISSGGFMIQSPDGDYRLKIGGYVDVDARQFADNKKDLGYSSSIIPRHINPIIQGTVARDFDYFFQADFGYNNVYQTVSSTGTTAYNATMLDAYLEYKYFPWAKIRAGKFKVPFDIENLQDVARYSNFAELGLTANLSPLRDTGVQVGGSILKDRLTYAVGLFGGAADRENFFGGNSTSGANNNNRDLAGRIFVQPFKGSELSLLSGLGVGYAATYGHEKGTDLPNYITPGQAPIFSYNSGVSADGAQVRQSPQFYYYFKSFGLIGEYVNADETLEYKSGPNIIKDRMDNSAWQLTGSYVLTGENASYWGVTPNHNFDPSNGHWGAFELAGRYGEMTIDHNAFDDGFASLNTSVSKENAWGIGLNWYLNTNLKMEFDFEQTKFRRGAPNGVSTDDRKTENLFTTRLQLSL
ncbi:MAG: hypothetical protein KGJ11_00115 [Candidatus Omnitrophica bacterium]|nr:hypothetical protein [Candidatus Omnitrophota bacterium]